MRPLINHHQRIGVSLIVFSLFSILLVALANKWLIVLVAKLFSPDGNISAKMQALIVTGLILVFTLLLLLGLYLWRSTSLIQLYRAIRVFGNVFVCGQNCRHPSERWLVILPNILGVFLILHIFYWVRDPVVYRFLYLEDGVFETLTPIIFLISGLLLGKAIWRIYKQSDGVRHRRWLMLIYAGLIGLFFFYAMEEISWGQRIFGWATSSDFAMNAQKETNLHNFFNRWFKYVYPSLSLVIFLPLTSWWFELRKKQPVFSRLVLPHASLLGIALMITLIALLFPREQELIEELFSVAVLFYSLRLHSFIGCNDGCVRETFTQPIPSGVYAGDLSVAKAS